MVFLHRGGRGILGWSGVDQPSPTFHGFTEERAPGKALFKIEVKEGGVLLVHSCVIEGRDREGRWKALPPL